MMLYVTRHRWISRALMPLCAIVGAIALQACDRPQAQNKAEKAATPLPVVTTSKPVVSDVVEWDEYTGRFEAVASVEIRARVSGYVDQIAFTDGQSVKKGDLLFVIDPRPFERVLATANAELEQARMKVQNTTLDVDRGRPLVERKIMSEKVFEDRASLQREAEAAVKVTEAKVASAELELSFTRITAPIDGRLSRANISLGSWISAGGTANATVLTQIVTQDPIQIYFDISENNYIKYKRLAERSPCRTRQGGSNIAAAWTSWTIAWIPAPQRCAPVRWCRMQNSSSRRACSRASGSRGRLSSRRCCCRMRPSAPTRRTSSCSSLLRTGLCRGAMYNLARCIKVCAWSVTVWARKTGS